MLAVFEKLLALPESITTPAQRAAWTDFYSIIPPLPLSASPSGPTIAAAEVLSSPSHNNEGPELYAIHPHRLFTVGRAVASGSNISLGVRTTQVCGHELQLTHVRSDKIFFILALGCAAKWLCT